MDILITGASRGIGRATAIAAARKGWRVAVNYRNDVVAAEQTLIEIRKAGGDGVLVPGDVGDPVAVAAMFDAAVEAFGGLDGVVANAGIVAMGMDLADMDTDRIDRIVRVNLLGAIYTAREAARRLGGDRKGSLVLVSSSAAKSGAAGLYVDYAAAKAGVDLLAVGLSKEVARRGVRVNSVRPGVTVTDIHADSGDIDRPAQVAGAIPLGRAGLPEEIAEAVIFLLDEERSSYVTGAILDVTGGR